MKNPAMVIAAFALGSFLGSGATYIFMKKEISKIEKTKEEEISSAREVYSKMAKELQDEKKELMKKNELEKNRIMDDYKSGLTSFGYVQEVLQREEDDDLPKFAKLDDEKDIADKEVYLITQDEYGLKELDNGDEEPYDGEILIYYHDGIVTDVSGEVVEDPTELLGNTVMELLPTYDSSGFTETYVRNDILKKDFMIDIAGCDFAE